MRRLAEQDPIDRTIIHGGLRLARSFGSATVGPRRNEPRRKKGMAESSEKVKAAEAEPRA